MKALNTMWGSLSKMAKDRQKQKTFVEALKAYA